MPDTFKPMAVSAADAAKLLGVSKPKVYDLIATDGFPSFKIGSRTLISVEGLREWIEKQVETGGNASA